MGPIEILFFTVVLIFGFIGLVRGSNRELGNAIIFMYIVALLGVAGERGWIENVVTQIAEVFAADPARINEVAFVLLTILFVVIIVVTYQGKTFDFSANKVNGCLGLAGGFAIGAFNGYLIAGTLWFYAAKYQYPFNMVEGDLTTVGATILRFSPPAIFPDNAFYWAIPATILLIVRVLR